MLHAKYLLVTFISIWLIASTTAQLDPLCSDCESKNCTYLKSLVCNCAKITDRVIEIGSFGDREYTQVSLGIAIDDTGSMSGVISAVKATVQAVVTATSNVFDKYILATFNDPYVFKLTESGSVAVINSFVGQIIAHDGGDCPEMALTGIRDVANRATVGSAIFVITDASAKDLELEAEVKALLLAKDIRLNVIVVGSLCGVGSELVRLANATAGSIYYTPNQFDVQYVMDYIAKYAKYGVRFIRGLPKSLADLKILTTEDCSCSTGLVRNISCILPVSFSSGGVTIKDRAEKTTSSSILGLAGSSSVNKTGSGPIQGPALRWTAFAIGVSAIVEMYTVL